MGWRLRRLHHVPRRLTLTRGRRVSSRFSFRQSAREADGTDIRAKSTGVVLNTGMRNAADTINKR